MSNEREQLQAGIAALEGQRALLGDAVADAALLPLRSRLAALSASAASTASATAGRDGQRLRQVSILFMDIVGSTTLSQHLDPEDIHAVMDGALARCSAIVASHQGKVLQYAGDSLLAVFGADAAREDDPQRAVQAGLALLAEGRALGQEILTRHGHAGFDLRVGVHTGGVLLGGGVDDAGSIRGIAVNIAARMEQTAPAGGLRISHDAYRHVRGVFDVEPQPPLVVKGVDEPVLTYLVKRAKPRAFRVATRGIEGVETRMIGRDAELERLQQAFLLLHDTRLGDDGCLLFVSVVGEAGLGKSRLLYEFENWAEARPESFYIFRGRAYPQSQNRPYGLLRDILAWRLQIGDDDSVELARHKIEQGIAPLFRADDGDAMAEAHAHLLGQLIGLDFSASPHVLGVGGDARQIRNRGFHAAAQMFRRVAAQGGSPIVLLLEDLHWADEGSLDFLSYLREIDRDVPMLVLALARPALFERRSGWLDGAHQRIELTPLDPGVSRLLANELLKKLDDIPAALRELISGNAEGNPFYMEELVKMLVDEGAIRTDGERWSLVTDRLRTTHVPQTLVGVLQARLDGLKGGEKPALQQASVIGFVFWDQALAILDERSVPALSMLAGRELIERRPDSQLQGAREFAFKHHILHQVTYATLLKRARQDLHARTARWMAGLSGSRGNHLLGETAEHFEKAGDHAQACEFFTRAAENAAGRYAHDAAMRYVTQALALATDGDAAMRWRLLDVRERTFDMLGRRAEQQADIDALQALAEILGDDRRRAEVAWRRCDIALHTGDPQAMMQAAREAMARAEQAGDAELGLRAQHRLALGLRDMGDAAQGFALAEAGLQSARALGLRRTEARFLNALANISLRQGDPVASLAINQQLLVLVRDLGDRLYEAKTTANLGVSWLDLGNDTDARPELEEGLRLARLVGDHTGEVYPQLGLSQLALRRGDDAAALAHARAALKVARDVQDPLNESTAFSRIGHAELALGRHPAASEAFDEGLRLALAIDDVVRHDARSGLARVALARGDVETAMQQVNQILGELAAGGTLEGTEGPHLIRLTCHQVLRRAGDERAETVLAQARAELLARAATITDASLRDSFLSRIPEHREIIAAWSALHPDR
jgi:class 3 adenylate cyclase/tetratricopeptide (TPR) repeat protein